MKSTSRYPEAAWCTAASCRAGGPAGLGSQRRVPAGSGRCAQQGRIRPRQPRADRHRRHVSLTALPGAGLLAVEAPTGDFIRVALDASGSGGSAIARPHGFAWVDLPADQDKKPTEVRLTLRKGVRLEARLVGPDGAPVGLVMGWCPELIASQLENWTSPQPFPDGRFRLDGADPERSYRVFFVEPKLRLGAVAELRFDPKGSALVRLQPTATAKGTVVDEKGRPLGGSDVFAYLDSTKGDRELEVQDFLGNTHAVPYIMFTMEPLLQTYPAEFNYDRLIPGVRYYVVVNWTLHPIAPLKPGEVRDLGKVVVRARADQ